MTEIKKTLIILKTRWPEVSLILGLNLFGPLLEKLFLSTPPFPTLYHRLLYLCFFVPIALITTMFVFGFLRAVHLEEDKRQSPFVLLQIGKRFFGRIIAFSLIFGITYTVLFRATLHVIGLLRDHFVTSEALDIILETLYLWSVQLSNVLASTILIKPLVFMPALIIVLDCSLVSSWKLLKRCRLLEAKELLILILIWIVWALLNKFCPLPMFAQTFPEYFLIVLYYVIFYLISLIVAVTAIKLVASLNLVYDNRSGSSNSGGLPEGQINSSIKD